MRKTRVPMNHNDQHYQRRPNNVMLLICISSIKSNAVVIDPLSCSGLVASVPSVPPLNQLPCRLPLPSSMQVTFDVATCALICAVCYVMCDDVTCDLRHVTHQHLFRSASSSSLQRGQSCGSNFTPCTPTILILSSVFSTTPPFPTTPPLILSCPQPSWVSEDSACPPHIPPILPYPHHPSRAHGVCQDRMRMF